MTTPVVTAPVVTAAPRQRVNLPSQGDERVKSLMSRFSMSFLTATIMDEDSAQLEAYLNAKGYTMKEKKFFMIFCSILKFNTSSYSLHARHASGFQRTQSTARE